MTELNSLERELSRGGWSQTELARRSGVARETINRIAAGQRPVGRATIAAFCWALGVPPATFADLAESLPEGPRA